MRIVLITHFHGALRGLMEAAHELDRDHAGWGSITVFDATEPLRQEEAEAVTAAMTAADTLIIDLLRAHDSWGALATTILPTFTGNVLGTDDVVRSHAKLGSFKAPDPGTTPVPGPPSQSPMSAQVGPVKPPAGPPRGPGGMVPLPQGPEGEVDAEVRKDAQAYAQIIGAYHRMRKGDARYVLSRLARDYGGYGDIEVIEPEQRAPGVYLADPKTGARYESPEEFNTHHPGTGPVLALLYNGNSYPTDPEPIVTELVAPLSRIGRVIPIAVETDPASAVASIRELLTGRYRPEAIINTMSFRLGAGPMGGDVEAGVEALKDIDAPLFHTIQLARYTEQEWRESWALSPAETLVSVMLPEFDGTVGQIPVASKVTVPGTRGGVDTSAMTIIPEQVDRLVGRVASMLHLRHLANSEKRVAIIGYDYPAGEGALLAASQLDVARSIEAILGKLAGEGYSTRSVPADQIRSDLVSKGVNSPSYSVPDNPTVYRREDMWADLNNPRARAEVEEAWPADAELPMVDPDGNFLIPGVEYGNVLVGVQPGRARVMDSNAAHDNTMPPHPQYLAYYVWLREVWKADVIVHVGTHGTFEFLKSRENTVSARDFPDLMLGNTPHVYLYYISNPAEGLAVRRRSHGVLVSYQSPVMKPGGLTDDINRIDDLLDAYRRGRDMVPQAQEDIREEIAALAEKLHLPGDPAELEGQVERLKAQLVPMGLHVYGDEFGDDEIATMVRNAIAGGVGDLPPGYELIARGQGIDTARIDAMTDREIRIYEEIALELVGRALATDTPADEMTAVPEEILIVEHARQYALAYRGNREWDGLLRALDGRHVEARLGGDPIRTPDVLPSGSNLYQFDPRQVPSPLATRRGKEMAKQLKAAYAKDNDGKYPTCVGLVLWGLETTRTHGETYAQILSLIGIRMLDKQIPGLQRWEVIPTEELEEPRCDVVVTISGFFRDLFPTLIDELDDMFAAVSVLDEPEDINPIAARTRATRDALLEAGRTETEAAELGHVRLFGPKPGSYATGLVAVIEDGAWETTADLADHFSAGSNHVYSKGRHGEKNLGLYRGHLGAVDVVSQLRSNNEFHITDLDHYFEFLGGMSAAVTQERGQKVTTIVADTTGRRVHTATAKDAARAGLYSQLLNPAWTEAMLAHGHQGVGEISARTTNLLGLAATTEEMEDWMFDSVYERYIEDPDMLDRIRELNPHATADVAARLTEAARRDLWGATPEQLERLDDVQFDIDADLEGDGA